MDLVTRCSGPEPGYIATPICFVQAARVMLKERPKVSLTLRDQDSFRRSSLFPISPNPLCLIALLILAPQVRKGVLTPAVAFADTSLLEEMKKDGRVTFERLE